MRWTEVYLMYRKVIPRKTGQIVVKICKMTEFCPKCDGKPLGVLCEMQLKAEPKRRDLT